MFRRRARDDREFRQAQREALALRQIHAQEPWPSDTIQTKAPAADNGETVVPDFPPADLRAPSRHDVEGVMMRWMPPLVIDGEVHACPQCGTYRDWIVFNMNDDSVWLRCTAGHQVMEPRLDAAWFNRNCGPVDHWHPTLEDGLRHLGH
ncbi:hypothetical protein [Streptomyces dysideae]|uniref:Uncharacterized protein n=1 Tax=Streptomyces dysideae TaxID=909626 RepID=A0A101V453_9ACTN|nr:hypothetical protein [Streptomyces dysideae]KUO22164.1 hypothetical protein AQJ91_06235 [Streptomyces dysideae]